MDGERLRGGMRRFPLFTVYDWVFLAKSAISGISRSALPPGPLEPLGAGVVEQPFLQSSVLLIHNARLAEPAGVAVVYKSLSKAR